MIGGRRASEESQSGLLFHLLANMALNAVACHRV
jgi:hypothetical protein